MKSKIILLFFSVVVLATGCSISYKLNGASIDYSRIKTISIQDFPNQASLVYPPFSQKFTETLKDFYSRQTKLKVLTRDGDLHLEGEIVGYDLTPMATGDDGYASETKLTVTINVRFVNNVNPEENFEERFVSFRTFDATKMLDDVQNALIDEISKEIADVIFNKTVANW
jgi:hypothetical protein